MLYKLNARCTCASWCD